MLSLCLRPSLSIRPSNQRRALLGRPLPALGLVLLAFGATACRGESHRAFHLLIVSVGALDDAALDAVDPKLHPNLHAWKQISTRYSRVQVEHPDGLATTASQFTGLRAEEHGAGFATEGGEAGQHPLDAEQTPMAEYFIEHGYNPGAIVGGETFFDPKFGLDQGFREYEWIPADAEATALLGVDWIDSHIKQPFYCFVGLPTDPNANQETRLAQIDRALGHLLGSLTRHGIMDSALVVVTANRPSTPHAPIPLGIKAPRQSQKAQDSREIRPYHLPQLILQHATLPVAAVRPNSYLRHPLPAPESLPHPSTERP